jgi:phosphate transport system substrate-binding protein
MSLRKSSSQRTSLKVINALVLLFSGFFLLNCTERQDEETARSGKMTFAVDQQLEDIARIQTGMFSRYYPEAHITPLPVRSDNTIKLLLDRSVRAAVIDGETAAAEDSLFAKRNYPLRREPIARDALVCIVNSKNPLRAISVEELGELFFTSSKKGVTPLIENDYRLRSFFAAKTGKKGSDLRASTCGSHKELILRVSSDKNAFALLFNSSLVKTLNDMALHSRNEPQKTRILLLSGKSDNTPACLPTQQNMFEGSYPLVTTLYYVYYPGDALAAGFGAWLGSSGQKVFERSSFAPHRLVERTIILK